MRAGAKIYCLAVGVLMAAWWALEVHRGRAGTALAAMFAVLAVLTIAAIAGLLAVNTATALAGP